MQWVGPIAGAVGSDAESYKRITRLNAPNFDR